MQRLAKTVLPTRWGQYSMIAYANTPSEMPHLALVHGEWNPDKAILVRIHSECMTGDVFGSVRCDCGEQLEAAMKAIAAEGGMVLYLRQEGRGIGLVNKMHAYNLQDEGFDTAEANTKLGFEIDSRKFDIAIKILEDLGVKKVRLMTNNPEKLAAFDNANVSIVERVPLEISPRQENKFYLHTKQRVMGHLLNLSSNGNGEH